MPRVRGKPEKILRLREAFQRSAVPSWLRRGICKAPAFRHGPAGREIAAYTGFSRKRESFP